MDEQNDILAFDITKHMPPPFFEVCNNQSDVWDRYNELSEPKINEQAKCRNCGSLIKFVSGISAMVCHLRRCKGMPDNSSTPIFYSHFFAQNW